jgi:uncharacterized membrane protein YsdA (DUF1294 family)
LIFAAVFLACVVGATFAGRVPVAILGLYIVASVVAFVAYARDKSAAKKGVWRIQENTLHLFALAGGWPGALVAQDLLCHKSNKRSFQIVFRATVVLNCAALGWLLFSSGADAIRSSFGMA